MTPLEFKGEDDERLWFDRSLANPPSNQSDSSMWILGHEDGDSDPFHSNVANSGGGGEAAEGGGNVVEGDAGGGDAEDGDAGGEPHISQTESQIHDEALAFALCGLLSTRRATEYQSWMKLGLCLSTVFEKDNVGLHLFKSISSRYFKYMTIHLSVCMILT